VIFLTVGTHEPFDRLVRAVDAWCAVNPAVTVFGQITGQAKYQPVHFSWVGKLSPEEHAARSAGARFLISHAGMGSIITALTYSRPIVVLPRRGHLNETRNDHQYATARKLGGKPGILVAETEAELPALLDRLSGGTAVATAAISPWADDGLLDALRGVIAQALVT
jgi:UDP-N-acetylglucosamine transferase subunit ALG13